MADNKFVTLEALKSTAARLQQEWLKSISKAGHATFRKAEAIPTVDEAQDNVMYLVMNDKTQHYDIYAKVEGAVVLLDDTTVDLSGYATKEQLEAVSGGLGGTVYAATKADLSASDDSVISGYFDQNKDAKPKKGDAQSYAKTNPTAYVGQMLSVVVNGTATPYVIQNAAGDLAPLGAAAVTIASDDEANEMLTEIFGE